MEERFYGTVPTLETRAEAHDSVDKQKRYRQIIECLSEARDRLHLNGLTAKEIAVMMMKKGYIPTSERNFTAPRLTEMSQDGLVEPIGKMTCSYTGKKVTVYALREGHKSFYVTERFKNKAVEQELAERMNCNV